MQPARLLRSVARRFGGLRRTRISPWNDENILREELFSIERLEQHATTLAAAQKITQRPVRRPPLTARLDSNEYVLLSAYRAISRSAGEERLLTPAAEWLLDNFHLVETQIRAIREDLPTGFYRQLPKLADGPFIGYPRVFGIAWAFVAHTDSHFELDKLIRFVRAYQQVQPLTIGELWAVAITVRFVLIENLRRAAQRIMSGRAARQSADDVADLLLGVNGKVEDPGALLDGYDNKKKLNTTFVVQLVQRLRDQDPDIMPSLAWLEQRLAAQGTTMDAAVRDEHQRQAASNVTVRNIITSMRLIAELEWSHFFENVSLVDEALRAGSAFAQMEFATRNLYRNGIEELARGSKYTELEIANAALADTGDGSPRRRDPGYRLIGSGRRDFEKTIDYRAPLSLRPLRWLMTDGAAPYLGAILLVAALLLAWPLMAFGKQEPDNWALALLVLLGLLPALNSSVAFVNTVVTRSFGATILPAMALSEGVPPELRTIVVVPLLLTSEENIEKEVERLEIHYLAAPEGDLHFALLSDWMDADTEHTDSDAVLLDAAARGIAKLNRRYGASAANPRFLLLHRRRVWSETQQQWIGWERKRGKLHELNRLLSGATDTNFIEIHGRTVNIPSGVRYVITLDEDTRLPRDTIRRLIGKLAHPLNQARLDPDTGRVVEGYAILQPRVTPALPMAHEGSLFQRIISNAPGIDPYAAAVSDVYQDLFGEGSFAGKGIYDVDAFEAALADRVPGGALLSHDLFEGLFARAGLVSDIEVVEDFPARYDVAAAREHRWVRGDWQLLPWILRRYRASADGQQTRSLPLISIWKMVDNLRRSLTAPSIFVALAVIWLLPREYAFPWTGFILAMIAVPILLPVVAALLPKREDITFRSHMRALGKDLQLAARQFLFQVTFLPHQACLMADAIVRTLYRLFVSRRNLLEWVTAQQASLRNRPGIVTVFRHMSAGIGITLVVLIAVFATDGAGLPLAISFAILWLAAPALSLWISQTPPVPKLQLINEADARALRLVARRTWRFFETFVTAEDHMLPPDNFQEDPNPVLAHRTSPTNIGLYLLTTVSARDLGWLGTLEALERLEATFETMGRMQQCRGHLYNWYATRDLRPLDPRYVSSVDSGNLAAHLIAVANAMREWADTITPPDHYAMGVEDALTLARQALEALPDHLWMQSMLCQQLAAEIDALTTALQNIGDDRNDLATQLQDIGQHGATLVDIARTLASDARDDACGDLLYWSDATHRTIESWRSEFRRTPEALVVLRRRLFAVATVAESMAFGMDFRFLVDPQRRLLSIGYRDADGTLDPTCYDLLASEARLASFFAIAKGDAASRHWFRLGRPVTAVGSGAALISWSGSMFEYLMPSLVLRAPVGSLMEHTNRLIVQRQISYADELNLPWGISESAYNARDVELTYQYSNFGVPGLGLKRGLSSDAVVAPYATALAAMVDPGSAARNFANLAELGALGRYGYYEALDFTRSRLPADTRFAVVRAYMAHHQGMTVVALANVLLHGIMRNRFHAEPRVQATELLLQERSPREFSVAHPQVVEVRATRWADIVPLADVRRLKSVHEATPQVHLLSNGRYTVMITGAGSGYSRWNDLGVTRWHEDITRDDTGSYIFLREIESDQVWSAGYQPCGTEPDNYQVCFTEDRAEFIRTDSHVTTTLEIIVSPEDDAELRHLTISNNHSRPHDIEVTSYSELVLTQPATDAAHQAFAKLFVQTEYLPRQGAILATRRKRSPSEPDVWAAHYAVVEGEVVGAPEIETDRARFLGRGMEVRDAISLKAGRRLSNTVGTVLDPVFALRYRVRIPAGGTARLAFWTAVASSRTAVLDILDKHQDANAFERAATLAWTHAQVQLRHLGVTAAEANLFQRLAGHVLFADSSLRSTSDIIRKGGGGPAGLWSEGISGDLPIVLLRIGDMDDIAIARQLLQAHEYWRMKQLAVDVVILNERAASYMQDLQAALMTLARASQICERSTAEKSRGLVYVLRSDMIPAETQALLTAVARIVLVGQRGSLAEQLDRARRPALFEARTFPRVTVPANNVVTGPAPQSLEFFNGLGGFAENGTEYVTLLGPGQCTPAPWINVVANPAFGFQVAAEGSGYTWAVNSRENQLTAWSNDPVTNRPGEAIFLRDENTGDVWGPTASPCHDADAYYAAHHGQGYSRFTHESRGLALDLLQYVPLDDPIKISRLTIHNRSGKDRRLSVTAYVEWVLGVSRAASGPHIVTAMDTSTNAMFARNPWNTACGSRVAFADLAGLHTDWTGDRREFLGRHGTLAEPAALFRAGRLSRRVGAGLDPCCALQTTLNLAANETAEIVFFLGETADAASARALVLRYRSADLDAVYRNVVEYWKDVLGTVQVRTPDRAMDIILNRWMLYQTLVCRLWARSAFYQASGAYGFRDQLQDGMALVLSQPAQTRDHLLRAAGRQFIAGDVQHWWLPTTGQGVRTRISDDRIWLAYCVARYIEVTGDSAVLQEQVPFIDGPALRPGEHDAFFTPVITDERASLFEHCARALDQSLAVGEHGLPLIGTGDWNDGMNRVGELGRGESVWLGWFLYTTLQAFAPFARQFGDEMRNTRWLAHADALQSALEQEGWDGNWYRRGYFDDGTPLGSVDSEECRIDSIAQSWSVISGAADPARAAQAMAELDAQLTRRDSDLALLFTPPFDRTSLDPGYIKGYPPGIRENGGQYTHAATWSVLAFTQLGHADKAIELYSILNPVNRAATRAAAHCYKVEPYVVAGDVYSVAPHAGRGGWTWYTGSAAWMYRAGLEGILGLQLQGNQLRIAPCIPAEWPGFEITFRYRATLYEISVENPAETSGGQAGLIELDGQPLPEATSAVALADDGHTHRVRVVLQAATSRIELPLPGSAGAQFADLPGKRENA